MLLVHSVPTLHWAEALLRLSLAAALGGAVGFERELRDREAGLRTHMLVALGSALFTIVSAYGFHEFLTSGQSVVRADPTRIAAQIVTGIGFLGAGAIIRQGLSVRGLTTAATLWVVAALGLAAGAGYYSGAVITTALVLFALYPLRIAAYRLIRRLRPEDRRLLVELPAGMSPAPVIDGLERFGARLVALTVTQEGDRRRLELDLDLPPATGAAALATPAAGVPGGCEARGAECPPSCARRTSTRRASWSVCFRGGRSSCSTWTRSRRRRARRITTTQSQRRASAATSARPTPGCWGRTPGSRSTVSMAVPAFTPRAVQRATRSAGCCARSVTTTGAALGMSASSSRSLPTRASSAAPAPCPAASATCRAATRGSDSTRCSSPTGRSAPSPSWATAGRRSTRTAQTPRVASSPPSPPAPEPRLKYDPAMARSSPGPGKPRA